MTPERWQRIESLLEEAMERSPSEREAFIRTAAGPDEELAEEVLRLAKTIESSGDFMVRPAAEDMGEATMQEAFALAEHGRPGLLDDAFPPGSLLDKYRILRRLGQGGMGTVYLAERADGNYDSLVAIKVVKRGMDTDEILTRFRFERQVLAQLVHPNIARLYDGGVTDTGLPFLAMEYVEGERLDAYCDRKRLTVDERLRMFESVCEAVRFAHQNLIVHRDLKPGNILVTEAGEVRLLDFGIAKLLDPSHESPTLALTDTDARRLTPEYAAPEQVSGLPVTTATDVYALGMILYELLAGRRPYWFESRRLQEIEEKVVHSVPTGPSTAIWRPPEGVDGPVESVEHIAELRGTEPRRLRHQLAGDLDAIVLKALKKEPEKRYPTAGDLLTDLQRYRSGHPVEAIDDSTRYRLAKFVGRNRGVVTATSLAFLSLVVGLIVSLFFLGQARENQVRAESVREYLVEILNAGDVDAYFRPETALDKNFEMRELIALGFERIGALDHPLDSAEVYDILGELATAYSLPELAERGHESAYAIKSVHLDEADPRLIRTLEGWALAHYNLSLSTNEIVRLDLADSLCTRAFFLRTGLRPTQIAAPPYPALSLPDASTARDAVVLLNHWGQIVSYLGRAAQSVDTARMAASLHRYALHLARRWFSVDDSTGVYIAESYSGLGSARYELGMLLDEHAGARDTLEAGIDPFTRAIEIFKKCLGTRHSMLGKTYTDYAYLLVGLDRRDDAISQVQQALTINEEAYGSPHVAIQNSHTFLSNLYRSTKPDSAADHARKAEEQRRLLASTGS